MKIAIIGYSGSGKSTLAKKMADIYQTDVLHFDTVQFLPNWEIRSEEEKLKITREFLDSHDSWVIDGTYSKLCYDRRMEEADEIIMLLFNRFSCFFRALRRYRKYKNTTRPDMAEGCNEKFDFDFATWILWRGRSRKTKDRHKSLISKYGEKVVVIKNQRRLDEYIKEVEKSQK